ncbi:MAPEG family protein [Sedimentitalea sp. HM32M-2]|uniref:MAPEG family protein n=1 Tax=Sedimentitalea sp. HM32M-2 TaxID=3351566 RepID=UPI00362BF2BC
MRKRRKILLGMAAGALWALALVGGVHLADPAYLPPALALPGAFFVPGLVLIAMIGRLAQRRFFDDALIDGEEFAPGSPAWVDQRVLSNTMEQLVLAIAVWPFVAFAAGGAVVLALGVGFGIARLAFWIGYHAAPPLRAFGFAGTFYPTILAAIWTLAIWIF